MDRVLIISLFAGAVATSGLLALMLRERWRALRWIAMSAAGCYMEYVAVSAALFLLDGFQVPRALAAQTALNLLLAGGGAIVARAGKRRVLGAIDWSLEGCVLPLALATLALILAGDGFGFFGMGQDEGVYQTQAIDFMNGKTDRVYHFEEYDKLPEDQRDALMAYNESWLTGLYSVEHYWTREAVLALPEAIEWADSPEIRPGDANYHGIPTYPALLALFGLLGGGYGHMMDAQPVLYALCVLLLWFAAENLGLKKGASLFACLMFLLAPQSLWLARSSLTEMPQAMVLCAFMVLVTEPQYKRRRWWAAFAVVCFACLHITVYVLYPLFFVVFALLYLRTGDRQYVLAGGIASLGYVGGMVFMAVVSPFYVAANVTPVVHGPITWLTAWHALVGMGVAGLLAAIALAFVRPQKYFRKLRARWIGILFRVLVVALVALPAVNLLRSLRELTFGEALSRNGLCVLIWITGIVPIPAAVVHLLRRGSAALKRPAEMAVTAMFLYTVLLMAGLMKPDIAYCYYYSRYFGPFIPVACLMAGIALNRVRARGMAAGLLAGVLATAPFDAAQLGWLDDTFMRFDAVERVSEAIRGERAAAVFPEQETDIYRQLSLPLRAVGVDCYLLEEDVSAQRARLEADYDAAYFVGDMDVPACCEDEPFLMLRETAWMDDNVSFRLPWCPLPWNVTTRDYAIAVYRYERPQRFAPEQLMTTGRADSERITLESGEVQYGPYIRLKAGLYQVEIAGEGLQNALCHVTAQAGNLEIPIEEMTLNEGGVKYRFRLDKSAENVEFVTQNPQGGSVCIDGITLTHLDMQF